MSKFVSWCLGLATLLVLVTACLWDYYPPLGRQHLTVVFPQTYPGKTEPIVVTGKPNAADFLAVRYLDEHTITFVYDSWGHGGPTSRPIPVVPGRRYALELDLPSFAAVPANPDATPERLRVVFDSQVALDAKVDFHHRGAQHVFFGHNPAGGTTCDPRFRGLLFTADGHPQAGNIRTMLSRTERIRGWLWTGRWQLFVITLVSLGVGWGLQSHRRADLVQHLRRLPDALSALRAHRVFLLTTAVCCIPFTALLTAGSFKLIHEESFGNFYDYQALSLLQGRLDVPEACVSGEAFVHDGKNYGYFGPTPALLRLPLMIFGVAFGHLSRAAMLTYYIATLVGAYLVLLHFVRLLRPLRPLPTAAETILFISHIGLGSTVFFLGSRAYIYHEAILCGIMFAVWSCWCSLRFLSSPASRWWIAALLLGTLSVHARPPTGLFALVALAACAVLPFLSQLRTGGYSALRRPMTIAVLAACGVASFNALSYAKFRTIEGCPLRLNVQYDGPRLAKIEGKQFHLSNIPYGLDTYFFRPRLQFSPHFPWLYFAEKLPTKEYPAAKMDLPDRTLAFPLGLTGLFLLATLACAWAALRQSAARLPVAALWLAFLPLTLAMCAAIATAERYTGDFVPFFICAGALGLAALPPRRIFTLSLAAATLWCGLLTFAVSLHNQGQLVWGVPPGVSERYQQLRKRIDAFFHVPPLPPAP